MKKLASALGLMLLVMVGVCWGCPFCSNLTADKVLLDKMNWPEEIAAMDINKDIYTCESCESLLINEMWYKDSSHFIECLEKLGEKSRLQIEGHKNLVTSLREKYGWTQRRAERVANGHIYIGDTETIVLEAWGKPKDINRTTTAYGTSEQWVYGLGCYVYFKNGKVTAIQD